RLRRRRPAPRCVPPPVPPRGRARSPPPPPGGGAPRPCPPRRDAHQRRCPHGRDLSCARHHRDDDPRLGTPICPDCYDYTGHVLFNALAPELWRRFTIYLPRHLARLPGITQDPLPRELRARFVT